MFAMRRSGPQCEEGIEETRPVDEMGYHRVVVRGVPQPHFFSTRCVDELQQNFALRADDIVIATYPKCGTTWMQQIILSLLFGGDTSKVPWPMEQAPWLEQSVCNKIRRMVDPSYKAKGGFLTVEEQESWSAPESLEAPPRRAWKTHATAELAPWKGGAAAAAKVVVVTRNPKDACVSMFHHARSVLPFKYRGDFDHFVRRLFLPGEVESGCFWAWHAGWEEAATKHPEHITWVSFEELKRDFPGTVRRLADFLEIPASDEVIMRTMAASSFGSMKEAFEKRQKDLAAHEQKPGHLRKGEMGSWRNDIHGALLAEFEAVQKTKTASSGLKYVFDYGDEEAW